MNLRDRQMWIASATVVALSLVMLAATASAQQSHQAAMGVWVLNVQKSTFEQGTPRVQSSTFTQLPDGSVRIEIDGVDSDGKSFHNEMVSKFDGRQATRAGSAEPTTRAYRWLDEVDFEFIEHINGLPSAIGQSSTSKDGRVRTLTVNGSRGGRAVRNIEVYERR